MLELAEIFVTVDVEFWITVAGTDDPEPLPEIVDNLCPNECSDHGTCIESMHWILIQASKLIAYHLLI